MLDFHRETVFGSLLSDDFEALLHALVRYKAHICAENCRLRHDIVGIGPRGHGKCDGGLKHSTALRRNLRHQRHQKRPEEPQIFKHKPESEGIRIRRQAPEHGLHLFRHLLFEWGVRLHIIHERGKPCNRTSRRRSARVAAAAVRRELHVPLALLKNSDHSEVPVNSANRACDDPAALIDDEIRLHAAPFHFIDKLRAPVACPFFRAGRGKIYILLQFIPLLQQLFHCLKKSHHRAFRIRRAAAPDFSVRNIAGERLMLPFSAGRHDVLMTHEHKRPPVLLPLPVKKQISLDICNFQLLKHEREESLQNLVKALDLRHIMFIRVRHRLIPDHRGKLLCIGQCTRL